MVLFDAQPRVQLAFDDSPPFHFTLTFCRNRIYKLFRTISPAASCSFTIMNTTEFQKSIMGGTYPAPYAIKREDPNINLTNMRQRVCSLTFSRGDVTHVC